MYFIFFMILNIIDCANPRGKVQHTKLYSLMAHEELYMKESFGNKIDACKKYTTRTEFINTLNKYNIICTGRWCNNNYKYITSSNSYEVEHIIEVHHSELNNCNKNIYGNIIFAYGKWNRQVGQLNWNNCKNEKVEVYGKTIVDTAIKNIIKCDPRCGNMSTGNNLQAYTAINICVYIFIIFLIFVIKFNL